MVHAEKIRVQTKNAGCCKIVSSVCLSRLTEVRQQTHMTLSENVVMAGQVKE